MTLKELAASAITEVGSVLEGAVPEQVEIMAAPILQARRIALHGVGREGLMMKSLAMRLFHLGLDAHVVGDMTTPALGKGDLLIVSAGPGAFATVEALIKVASAAGANTMCVTANPDGSTSLSADHIVHLDAQTMANDQGEAQSVLPMGSLFEAVQFLFFEFVILNLKEQLNMDAETMRGNHTNLE